MWSWAMRKISPTSTPGLSSAHDRACASCSTPKRRAATIAPVTAHGRSAVELDEVALHETGVALGVDAYPHPRADCGQDPLVRVVLVTCVFRRRPRDAYHV